MNPIEAAFALAELRRNQQAVKRAKRQAKLSVITIPVFAYNQRQFEMFRNNNQSSQVKFQRLYNATDICGYGFNQLVLILPGYYIEQIFFDVMDSKSMRIVRVPETTVLNKGTALSRSMFTRSPQLEAKDPKEP